MNQRLMIYRKVAGARTDAELDQILNELRDRYGPLPEAVEHLEEYGRIRIMADRLGVESIDREGQTLVIKIRPDGKAERLNVERLIKVISARGDAKATTQIAELADGGQPLFRHLRQRIVGRNQQVRVRRTIRSSDAAAQLIEL